MEKLSHCNCTKGCETRRCSCFRLDEGCGEACGCSDCRNPLNGIDLDKLTICSIQHIEMYKALTTKELQRKLQLPCGDGEVPLKKLLGKYYCEKCKESYWYSFCWDRVVQDNCSWHCDICRKCRDWRWWHCDVCDKCTWGSSLPCEHCEMDQESGKDDVDRKLVDIVDRWFRGTDP